MSATHQMRTMLDELMGTARDGGRPRIEFDDYRVCKCYLLDCCPHDILAGTRMDLGDCDNIHDPALKADYNNSPRRKDYNFEKEACRTLERFLNNIDKKVKLAIKTLKETQEELPEGAGELADEIHRLGEQIGTKLAQAETLGAEGHVEESLKLMSAVDDLNRQKNFAEIRLRNSLPPNQFQQQKLRVCEVCSAYLGIQDNDRRLADHFGGKLHIGFINLRLRLDAIQKYLNQKSEVRSKRSPDLSDKRRDNRSRSRERNRWYENRSSNSRSVRNSHY